MRGGHRQAVEIVDEAVGVENQIDVARALRIEIAQDGSGQRRIRHLPAGQGAARYGDEDTIETKITREEFFAADEAERLPLLEDYLGRQVSRVLRIPLDELDVQQPLNNLGIDSLMAVEMTLDGQHVIFDDHGIRVVHIASGTEFELSVRYPLLEIETGMGSGLVATLGLGDERDPQRGFRHPAELVLFDHDGVVPARVAFPADRAFLRAVDGISYVGVDDRVLRFSVGVE